LPGNGTNSSSNSYNSSKQTHSLTTSSNTLANEAKDISSASSSALVTGAANNSKGITANCFYYDNTLHQLNINNNQHSDESTHKSLPGNSTFHQSSSMLTSSNSGSSAKLGDKFQQCESYQDLSNNRKSMTLNRLMSSSIHSASTLSLVSHNSTNHNSSASSGISASKLNLPQLNN
jgi:hypothetical protein